MNIIEFILVSLIAFFCFSVGIQKGKDICRSQPVLETLRHPVSLSSVDSFCLSSQQYDAASGLCVSSVQGGAL